MVVQRYAGPRFPAEVGSLFRAGPTESRFFAKSSFLINMQIA
jgi:hypothetical protein